MKKLRTHSQPKSRGLGWLQEKVDQLLKERQERLSRLREQQPPSWPMPPGMPEMYPLQHESLRDRAESPWRNRPRHESPGTSLRHESPHRRRMTELHPTESPRHREQALPPVPPWAEEWPDVPRGQGGTPEAREWLLEEWDFEDIPPPRHLLEGNTPRRTPHLPEWPPTGQWDAPRRDSRRTQYWGEFPPLTDETEEVERAKVNAAKRGGRPQGKRRRNKR